jgi:hypothetical protein
MWAGKAGFLGTLDNKTSWYGILPLQEGDTAASIRAAGR